MRGYSETGCTVTITTEPPVESRDVGMALNQTFLHDLDVNTGRYFLFDGGVERGFEMCSV